MRNNEKPAQTTYEAAVQSLQKFCEKHTDLTPHIKDKTYPYSVTFIPDSQISMFEDDNINTDTGEVGELTVTVGLSTTVKSTLRFRMESSLFKKLIKLAEQVGELYYHAFREEHGARIKPTRPEYEADGYDENGELVYDMAYCPECRHSFEDNVNDWGSSFCPECGQALDWTPEPVEPDEPEQDEFDAALEMLEDLIEEEPEA